MQLRRNSVWQRIGYLVFPGGFIILSISIGVGLLIHSYSNYQAAAGFRNKALSTTGIITETEWRSRTVGGALIPQTVTVHVSTIQFETKQGKVIKFEADDVCYKSPIKPDSCNSKDIQVLYDPDDPQLAMVKGGSSPLDRVRTQIVWGVLFIVGGILTFILAPTEYGGRFGPTRRS